MDLWDLSVWLQADDETILSRAVIRDSAYFGGPTQARDVYLTRLLPAQAVHRRVDSPAEAASIVFEWTGRTWHHVGGPHGEPPG